MLDCIQFGLLRQRSNSITFNGKVYPSEATFVFTVGEKFGMDLMWVCNNWRLHGTMKSLVDDYWGYDTSSVFEYSLIEQTRTGR